MNDRREYVADDGVRLIADVAGPSAGPTIVLAHGGGQTRHSWSHAFARLVREGYRVVNFDARGHGESGWSPDNRYPLERRWDDMARLIGEHTGPIGIVGASMGGGTALFGLTRSYRPSALVLVDIAPNSERAGMQRVRDFMASGLGGFASLEEAAAAVAAYSPSRTRRGSVSGLRRNLRQRGDGRWYWHWDPGMLDIDLDEEREKMAKTFDGLKAAASVPVLLVRGLESDVVTDRTVEEFKARIPDIVIADVGGAGHMVAGDRNDVFNNAVLGFLRRHMPLSTA